MEIQDIREGIEVTIDPELRETKHLWGISSEIRYMARGDRHYKVDRLLEMTPVNGNHLELAVEIDGLWFAPEDLELYEPNSPEEVFIPKGKVVKFNPASL